MIARKKEQRSLELILKRKKSTFLAITGRRRVGKTYILDTFFKDQLCFRMTGIQDATMEEQLTNFSNALFHQSKAVQLVPQDWQEAFFLLRGYLETLDKQGKKVIFIDELPWMVTAKSNMLQHLAHFWNDYLSKQPQFILVICGSASSWLTRYIINDKGGLHNRVTDHIHLVPFTLKETKEFLAYKGIHLSHQEITKIYMTFGGIPYYLDQIRKGENSTTAIERLCFSSEGMLKREYDNLYKALFRYPQNHEAIVEALSKKSSGLSRQQIIKHSKVAAGGAYDRAMGDLVMSGFVTEFIPFGKRIRGAMYRLNDEFSIFYHRFMKGNKKYSEGMWLQLANSQAYKIWTGYAFENICIKHSNQIKKALGISGVYTEVSSFRVEGTQDERGFQIDMVLDRQDGVIHLFEIKYYGSLFTIDKRYAQDLNERKQRFIEITGTKKQVFTSFITNRGVKANAYASEVVDAQLMLDDFFE